MAPATLTTTARAAGRPVLVTAGTVLVGLAAGVVLVRSTFSLVGEVAGGRPLTPYVATQYWLGYQGGFLRRGLPGQVLQLLTAGPAPSYRAAAVMAVSLSVAAVAAVVLLALLLARCAPDRWTALAVAATVVMGPLGLPLLARDLGRYDAIGVLVLVGLATIPWSRLPRALGVAGAAVLAGVAVASEEFLVVLVLPVAVVSLWPTLRTSPSARSWVAALALPSVVLAGLSAVVPARPAVLEATVAAARAAGVPPPVPLVPGLVDHDAVSRLAHGFVENVRTYYAILTPAGVVGASVIWAAVYLVLVGLVWHLVGRSCRQRVFVLLAVGGALAALALSVAGIDFRRWWSLAAVAVLCLELRLTTRPSRPSRPAPGGSGVLLLTLAGLSTAAVLLERVPAYWTPPWWR